MLSRLARWLKHVLTILQYGEIISIRFPSLKYASHRRFCYVQFKAATSASEATELDGKLLEGKFRLLAKHSDPTHKQDRTGTIKEGREVFVRNIHHSVTEEDLKTLFSEFGEIEQVRIPRNVGGKSKGMGFVDFASKVRPAFLPFR
jgi:hypothetical protein